MQNWFSSANQARYRHVLSGIAGALVGIVATLASLKLVPTTDAAALTDAINSLNTTLLSLLGALGVIVTTISGLTAGRAAQPLAQADSLEKATGAVVILPDAIAKASTNTSGNILAKSDVKAVVVTDPGVAANSASEKVVAASSPTGSVVVPASPSEPVVIS